jgi:hypothetical protein
MGGEPVILRGTHDPADHLIAATARSKGMALITRDRAFAEAPFPRRSGNFVNRAHCLADQEMCGASPNPNPQVEG